MVMLMGCDLCGKEGTLFQTRIEGTVMTVCASCAEYGEVVRRVPGALEKKREEKRKGKEPEPQTQSFGRGETILLVKADYAKRIKAAREKLNLKQEDLAKRLRMKESQLHAYESGHHKPDLETARTLEKELKISLVEEHVEERQERRAASSGPLTIGDLLKR